MAEEGWIKTNFAGGEAAVAAGGSWIVSTAPAIDRQLGALERAELGYFDWTAKKYQPIPVDEQVEVLTMVGDIAENERNEPDLHAHAVLGRRDGSTRGGHLMQAIVRPTLEITLSETPAHLKRRMHKNINVALIDIS